MPTNILILAKLGAGTGNRTTAERIRQHLNNSDLCPLLCDVTQFRSPRDLSDYVIHNDVTCLIVIHAYRAGKFLNDISIPFALVFGGTDVQCSSWNDQENAIMADVVAKAIVLIAFSEVMKEAASVKWPSILKEKKIFVQPQGVTIERIGPTNYSFQHLFNDNGMSEVKTKEKIIFLFVGGIRPVKDPLFLIYTFAQMHEENDRILFVIIGPILDEEYARKCRLATSKLKGIYMFDQISRDKVHALIHQSVALVNSSIEEGMAGAILESMKIETPVVVRNNRGNASIVQHQSTGLLFQHPQDFREQANLLLENSTLRRNLIQNAQDFIESNHNPDVERSTYHEIIKILVKP
eukprot:TCONS_00018973-protein